MLKARNLEVLCAVIEMGTTAMAAESLGISQPAVSNMIRHTEDQIGFPLFIRERGRLTPTREALHIADEARHLFRQQKRIGGLVERATATSAFTAKCDLLRASGRGTRMATTASP